MLAVRLGMEGTSPPSAAAPDHRKTRRCRLHGIGADRFVRLVAGLALAMVALDPVRTFAQPSMQTIFTNGPPSNRFNIVVLSEGYTNNELGQFFLDASNAVRTLLSHPPYREYSNYANAFAIKVASTQSGSDHPLLGIYRNTYFNSAYVNAEDNLITIPADSAGQGKVDSLLQTFMPRCHLAILLVNDRTQGASDGGGKTAIVSIGAVDQERTTGETYFMTHETGHVLANLGDEYTAAYPGFPDTEEPNTTQQTNRALVKWNAWILPNTPVPTADSAGDGIVGLFQGAHYHTTGWYRPQLTCTMGFSGVDFCAVCSEALVLSIYQKLRPVDAFAPAAGTLAVSNTQPIQFSLTPLRPGTHDLSVQWFTNGVPCPGAASTNLTLLPQLLPNGSNWVRALVRDNTSLVRNDPTNLLSQTVTWGLNVSIPRLRLDSPLWLTGGKFAFRVSGYAPQGFSIWGGTNLSNWAALSTNNLVAGQYWYTNTGAAGYRRQFFRALTPP
jgi:hypothetical protein